MSDTAPAQQPMTTFVEGHFVHQTFEVPTGPTFTWTREDVERVAEDLLRQVHDSLSERAMHFRGSLEARLVVDVGTKVFRFPADEIEDTPENRAAFQEAIDRTDGDWFAIDYYPRQEAPVMPQDFDPDEDEIGAPPHEPPQPS